MKKTLKLFSAFALASALAAGSLHAQETKPSENPRRPSAEVPAREHLDMRGPGTVRHGFAPKQENDELIAGKVKSVNASANILTITNLDGKDISVTVTPFTMIHIANAEPPKAPEAKDGEKLTPPPERPDIQSLSRGDWVIVSTLNTESKAKAAARIIAQKQAKPDIDADAK